MKTLSLFYDFIETWDGRVKWRDEECESLYHGHRLPPDVIGCGASYFRVLSARRPSRQQNLNGPAVPAFPSETVDGRTRIVVARFVLRCQSPLQ
ncbi:hypothetical protein BN2476_470106 [Paraburkholderia piptadeniae]|uniref:Uncharacterized protein n=1 Tax=Paraburkholderia piptadeniae TaxID=1701573 RepID=A0A1N7SFD4_9BURK|nr:hypothetical protein BN2476_470106 [Paraburkholderia piptadeniae]